VLPSHRYWQSLGNPYLHLLYISALFVHYQKFLDGSNDSLSLLHQFCVYCLKELGFELESDIQNLGWHKVEKKTAGKYILCNIFGKLRSDISSIRMGEIFEVRFEIHPKSGLKTKIFIHPTGPKMADFGILPPLGLSGVLVDVIHIQQSHVR
jgi:hypothetical protein